MVPGQRDTTGCISYTLKGKASGVKDEELKEHWWELQAAFQIFVNLLKSAHWRRKHLLQQKVLNFLRVAHFLLPSKPQLNSSFILGPCASAPNSWPFISPWGKVLLTNPTLGQGECVGSNHSLRCSVYPTTVVVYRLHRKLKGKREAQRWLKPCWWGDPWVRVDQSSHRRGGSAAVGCRLTCTQECAFHSWRTASSTVQRFLCAARNLLGLQVAASPWCPGVRSEGHQWNYKRTYPQCFESFLL